MDERNYNRRLHSDYKTEPKKPDFKLVSNEDVVTETIADSVNQSDPEEEIGKDVMFVLNEELQKSFVRSLLDDEAEDEDAQWSPFCTECGRDIDSGERMRVIQSNYEEFNDGEITVLSSEAVLVFCSNCASAMDFTKLKIEIGCQIEDE